MRRLFRARASLALVAVALVATALGLSACVSQSSGQAMDPPATPTATAIVFPTTPPTPTPVPIDTHKPAAIVSGVVISGADYAQSVAQTRARYAIQEQQTGTAPPSDPQMRQEALDDLILGVIMHLYARQHGITVTPAEVQALYNTAQATNGGAAAFATLLKSYDFTPATFRTYLTNVILQEKVAQQVSPLPLVDAVDARHILVAKKALAETLYAQLQRNPGRFAALAMRYSTDTSSAAQGGELGYFPRGEMTAPFEKVAFALKVGQISPPVKSQFGYHVIQVEAHQKVAPYQLNSQAQQMSPYTQELQRQQTAFNTWYTGQRKRAHVRILVQY